MTDKHPEFGARFELTRLGVDGEAARYAVHIYLPAARHDYELTISIGEGRCALAPTGAEPAAAGGPPEWALAHLLSLGRQLWRGASKDGAWQRRVMRWKDGP